MGGGYGGMGMGMGGMGQMGPPGIFGSSACSYQLQLCAKKLWSFCMGQCLQCISTGWCMLLLATLEHAQAPGMH